MKSLITIFFSRITITAFFILSFCPISFTQIKVGLPVSAPDNSAQLEVASNTRGFLPPRLTTTQRNAITNPATGLIIYNSTLNTLQTNTGTPASPSWSNSKDVCTTPVVQSTTGFNTSTSFTLTRTTGQLNILQSGNSCGRYWVAYINYNTVTGSITFAGGYGNPDAPSTTYTGKDTLEVRNNAITCGDGSQYGMQAGFKITGNILTCTSNSDFARSYTLTECPSTSIENIYTSDGFLTGNRTINLNNKTLSFNGAGTVSFTGNANVGIGNTSPNAPLQFSNAVSNRKLVLYDVNNNDHQYYGFGSNTNILRYQVASTAASHTFYAGVSNTSSNEIFRISGNGTALVPSYMQAGESTKGFTRLTSGSVTDNGLVEIYRPGGTREGYIGGGTTDLFYTKENGGSHSFDGGNVIPRTDNSISLGTSSKRWTAVYATNGTIQTSDSSLKTNIRGIDYGLQTVMAMHPVEYTWKNNKSRKMLGFLAQEMEGVIPESVVKPGNNNDYYGMQYESLIPVLTKAIQELQKEVDELKNENIDLKKAMVLSDRLQNAYVQIAAELKELKGSLSSSQTQPISNTGFKEK